MVKESERSRKTRSYLILNIPEGLVFLYAHVLL